jgi:hypothetical protein
VANRLAHPLAALHLAKTTRERIVSCCCCCCCYCRLPCCCCCRRRRRHRRRRRCRPRSTFESEEHVCLVIRAATIRLHRLTYVCLVCVWCVCVCVCVLGGRGLLFHRDLLCRPDCTLCMPGCLLSNLLVRTVLYRTAASFYPTTTSSTSQACPAAALLPCPCLAPGLAI